MKNHTANHDLFINGTKNLKILTGGDKYDQYHNFLLSALELLKKKKSFPLEASEWLDIARACLSRSISLEDVKKLKKKLNFTK